MLLVIILCNKAKPGLSLGKRVTYRYPRFIGGTLSCCLLLPISYREASDSPSPIFMARFCTFPQLGKLPCLEPFVLFEFALDLLYQMSFKFLGSAVTWS